MIIYKNNYIPLKSDIYDLYSANGWLAYTNNMTLTMQGIENSLSVITAYDDNKLVGLIRVIGDGATIIYIQDILVDPQYQKNGIGKALMNMVLKKYEHVRQKVLLTDAGKDTEYVRKFYSSLGFETCNKGITVAMARFDS